MKCKSQWLLLSLVGLALVLPAVALRGESPAVAVNDEFQLAQAPAKPAQREKSKAKQSEKPSRRPDVVFVPTPQEVVDRMLELAEVQKDDLVYDLGCGDGRIVVTAAKKYKVKAVGYDIDPQRVKEAKENVKKNGVEDLVTIKQDDIFTLDLSDADVVTLYLLPKLNVKLIPQLEKLKPGSRIVSHAFDMQGVKPKKVETVEAENGSEHTVYLWVTPLEKEDDAAKSQR